MNGFFADNGGKTVFLIIVRVQIKIIAIGKKIYLPWKSMNIWWIFVCYLYRYSHTVTQQNKKGVQNGGVQYTDSEPSTLRSKFNFFSFCRPPVYCQFQLNHHDLFVTNYKASFFIWLYWNDSKSNFRENLDNKVNIFLDCIL